MATLPLEFGFIDNNGNKAKTGMHILPPASFVQLTSVVTLLGTALASISNAGVQSANYRQLVITSPLSAPQAGSNAYSRLVLLFRDGSNRGLIDVPSPASLPFDVAGPYRATRLRREALELSGLLGPLESAAVNLRNPDGSAFPGTFTVAGKAGR